MLFVDFSRAATGAQAAFQFRQLFDKMAHVRLTCKIHSSLSVA
jgi:hypothetical protein